MNQQNIDRLFREKLGGFEAVPSPNAWSQVEKRIGTKKTPLIYWVAASITLLIAGWMLMMNNYTPDHAGAFISSNVDHPPAQKFYPFDLPEAVAIRKEEANSPKRNATQVTTASTHLVTVPSAKEAPTDAIPEVENKTMMAMEALDAQPMDPVKMNVEKTIDEGDHESTHTIKIIYIASSRNQIPTDQTIAKNDSISVLEKFLALADKIDPGEMLADIKTAKDNLLNGGLKNKKERSTMTP